MTINSIFFILSNTEKLELIRIGKNIFLSTKQGGCLSTNQGGSYVTKSVECETFMLSLPRLALSPFLE